VSSFIKPPLFPVDFFGSRGLAVAQSSERYYSSTSARFSTGKNGKLDMMASDEDYASFLDKANQDPNEGVAEGKSGKIELKAMDSGVEVPKVLQDATKDTWYTSDADEKFTPVVLNFKGKSLPDECKYSFSLRSVLAQHRLMKQSNIRKDCRTSLTKRCRSFYHGYRRVGHAG
jgi:hypothetical protein